MTVETESLTPIIGEQDDPQMAATTAGLAIAPLRKPAHIRTNLP